MPPSESIRFSPGLKKICQIVNPDLTLSTRAQKLLSKVMVELNRRLVTDCQDKSSSESGQLQIVQAVVNQAFQGEIKRLAQAEGNKYIFLYNCGLLPYRPRIRGLTTVKEKTKTFVREFSTGLTNLTNTALSGASLQAQGKKLLCKLLGVLSMAISDKARNFARQQIITHDEIKEAVENIIPGEMLRHALAEGSRMVLLLQYEKIVFSPARQRMPREVSKPVRKRIRKSRPTPRRRKSKVVSRPVSRAKKKQVAKITRPAAKAVRRRVSKPRKSVSRVRKRSVSKVKRRPVSKVRKKSVSKVSRRRVSKRPISKVRKRTVSKRRRPVSRKRAVSKRKRPVSKRKQPRKSVKRKRTPARKIVRRSRTPSPKRRRKVSAKKAKPVQKRKKKTSATPRPKPVRKSTKPRKPSVKKIKGVSCKCLEQGIKKANEKFQQSLSSDALKLIRTVLKELMAQMTEKVNRQKSSEIGTVTMRDVVIKTFPDNLKDLALARLSQVVAGL